MRCVAGRGESRLSYITERSSPSISEPVDGRPDRCDRCDSPENVSRLMVQACAMAEIWAVAIGVLGALVGSVLGAWMTARVTRQAQESAHREQFERERRLAFCEALHALLGYRARELRRIHEHDVSIDDVNLAAPAREMRSTCRYHLVVLRVLMPGDSVPTRYAALLETAQQISKQATPADGTALAATVKEGIESLAEEFAGRTNPIPVANS